MGKLWFRRQKKTLLLFDHYDVVPPGPLENWQPPPFEPVIRDNRIWARGAGDAKGQLFTYLKALEAWQAVIGELPINIRLALNGDDELGAPGLPSIVDKYGARLKADAVLFADASTLDVWGPIVFLGNRGVLALELIAHGPEAEAHSGSYGGLLRNPAVRLAQAIATMRDPDGRILITGFYDDLKSLGEIERSLLAQLRIDREGKLGSLGATEFWGDPGYDYFETQMYRPTLNIHGLSSGYQGEGWAAKVPTTATAKIDCNILPNMDHDDIKEKFRNHLDSHGFHDVEMREVARIPYATGATPDDPFLALVSRALERVWSKAPVLYPSIGGGGLLVKMFKERLENPYFLMVPYGQPDMNEHSPHESLDIDWFINGIKVTATVIDEFANSDIGK